MAELSPKGGVLPRGVLRVGVRRLAPPPRCRPATIPQTAEFSPLFPFLEGRGAAGLTVSSHQGWTSAGPGTDALTSPVGRTRRRCSLRSEVLPLGESAASRGDPGPGGPRDLSVCTEL